jgi:hypothetical protein
VDADDALTLAVGLESAAVLTIALSPRRRQRPQRGQRRLIKVVSGGEVKGPGGPDTIG